MANNIQQVKRTKLFVGYSTLDRPKFQYKLYDIDLIKRDLLNQFMTPRGARVMLPNFGCIIWELLFEPFTNAVREEIVADAKRVVKSDPRVELVSVNVTSGQQSLIIQMLLNYVPFNVTDSLYVEFKRNTQNMNLLT